MSAVPVVILCGGQGTRMRGDTLTKKELVKIGERPIMWHVMRIFSAHGFNDFVLTLGYEAQQIRRYFLNYDAMTRDTTIRLGGLDHQDHKPSLTLLDPPRHPAWNIHMVDTGLHTEKGSRIHRVASYLTSDRFFVAYGDDVSDVDLSALVAFHRAHGCLATITAVRIELPYGVVEADEKGAVSGFTERPRLPYWINGGFMLFERPVLELLAAGEDVNLETTILPQLAAAGELMIYRHHGFWQSMNTLKDKLLLERAWETSAPWKVW